MSEVISIGSSRFIADVHLGRLARDLRMVGFDTTWRQDMEDDELLTLSAGEQRVLLTRDRELVDRGEPSRTFYVAALGREEQMRTVLDRYGLIERVRSGRGFLSLCLECNSPILPVRGDQIRERVPSGVTSEFNEFYLCPHCERVFWKGSHFDRMRGWVAKLVSDA